MNDKIISIEVFTQQILRDLTKKSQDNKRLTTEDKTILDLHSRNQNNQLTKFEQNIFNRLIKSRYNVYKTEFDLKSRIEKEKKENQELLKRLRKSDAKSSVERRKARNHRLIQLGGLVELSELGFDDKGTILGALLYIKSAINHKPDLIEQFKTRGDEEIARREQERLARKEKNN